MDGAYWCSPSYYENVIVSEKKQTFRDAITVFPVI